MRKVSELLLECVNDERYLNVNHANGQMYLCYILRRRAEEKLLTERERQALQNEIYDALDREEDKCDGEHSFAFLRDALVINHGLPCRTGVHSRAYKEAALVYWGELHVKLVGEGK